MVSHPWRKDKDAPWIHPTDEDLSVGTPEDGAPSTQLVLSQCAPSIQDQIELAESGGAREEEFGAGEIGGRVDVEEPQRRAKAARVDDVPGLREELGGKNAKWAARCVRGCSKCGDATGAAGLELSLKCGQDGMIEDSGEGLREAIYRANRAGRIALKSVMQHARE